MIKVSLQPLDRTDKHLEAEWRRLEMRAKSSFFTSWDWVDTLINALPPGSHYPFLLRFTERAETIGLAYLGKERARRHLFVSSRRLHLNSAGETEFNCLTTEDNALLVEPELEGACWVALAQWFAHEQNLADELVLPGLRSPIDSALITGYNVGCDTITSLSYHIDLKRLERTGGRFVDLLSNNARYQLRRSMRNYGGSEALVLREATSIEEALHWFGNLKALHIDSWTRRGKIHSFSFPFFETFHRSLIQRTFGTGRVQMLCILASGAPIGYLYNFRDGTRTYAYQSGFADRNRKFRPGGVSHALAAEYNFRIGVDVYDFMAGTNQLKASFATNQRYMHWTTLQAPRIRFHLENAARHTKRRIFGNHQP